MCYHWLYPLHDWFFGFNVFRYITFRAAAAGLTAFLFSVLCAPWVIHQLQRLRVGQHIQSDISHLHHTKEGTPTMGGLMLLVAIVGSMILWGNWSSPELQIAVTATTCFGLIGFYDDFVKLTRGRSKGLGCRGKLAGQIAVGLVVGALLLADVTRSTVLEVPLFKHAAVELGWWYLLFIVFVVVGSSNAVNLTDGLDGLASGCVAIAALVYALFAYVTGHAQFAEYLGIFFSPTAGELSVFCLAMAGAALGFLWYNSYPAQVFMGDTGSLALGGGLGVVAVLIKKELLLVLVGGVFVLEALSVILQVASYRLRHRKRIFLMAPIHHHFQRRGWAEPHVTVRFWIVGALLALMSLATLKLR